MSTNRLSSSLEPFRLAPNYGEEVPWIGAIKYVDLHKERLNAGMKRRFFYKHLAFSWEKEFRVAITVRMAEEFGVNVPETGVCVDFHPANLIEAIHIGPELPSTDRDNIIEACKKVELDCPILTSTLLGQPRYF